MAPSKEYPYNGAFYRIALFFGATVRFKKGIFGLKKSNKKKRM